MTSGVLLCPLSDFPWMLPCCVPVGAVLLFTGLLPLAALLYRWRYYLRYQRVTFSGALRLRGRVGGVLPGELVYGRVGDGWFVRPFTLRRERGESPLVTPEGALLPGSGTQIRGGQAVSLLAMRGAVSHGRETLFRQPAAEPGFQALQIAPDRLSLVRAVTWAVVLGWAGFAGWLVHRNVVSSRELASLRLETPRLVLEPVLVGPGEEQGEPIANLIGEANGVGGLSGNDGSGTWRLARQRTGPMVPRVVAGRAEVRGTLDAEIIRRVIRGHINEVKYCYAKELQASPGLHGWVVVQFTVAASGQVVSSQVRQSSLGNVAAEGCIAAALYRWTFPRHEGIAIVSYPFVLSAWAEDDGHTAR